MMLWASIAKILYGWVPEGKRLAATATVMMFVATFAMLFHVLSMGGYLQGWGIYGAVTTNDLRVIESKVNLLIYDKYVPRVRSLVRQRCASQNFDDREALNQRLDELRKEYFEITGERIPMMRCDEV